VVLIATLGIKTEMNIFITSTLSIQGTEIHVQIMYVWTNCSPLMYAYIYIIPV